jgi:hypothetical protein
VTVPDEGEFTAARVFVASSIAPSISRASIDSKVLVDHMICFSRESFGTCEDHSLYFEPADVRNLKNGICAINYCESNQMYPEGVFMLHLWTLSTATSRVEMENLANLLSKGMLR